MKGWTTGEIELYRFAVSQGKRPIESVDQLAFLTPSDAEQLLQSAREGRKADAAVRRRRERGRGR